MGASCKKIAAVSAGLRQRPVANREKGVDGKKIQKKPENTLLLYNKTLLSAGLIFARAMPAIFHVRLEAAITVVI